MKKIGVFNICVLGSILALWFCILILHGLPGALSWTVIKLFYPVFGFALCIISIICLLVQRKRKLSIRKKCISLFLSIVIMIPILITLNIIPMAYPANRESVSPAITIEVPLRGETIVGWGGDTIEVNMPHVMWASERWAYDLLMEPYNTGSDDLESYGIWNQPVYSPVSGVVVGTYDLEEDILPNTEDNQTMEGNYVYIKIHETNTYLVLAHFRQGSLEVFVGDYVEAGDLIGRVGNSGSTSEPHLHIHQQRQNPLETIFSVAAEGLPLYFRVEEQSHMLEKGSIIIY